MRFDSRPIRQYGKIFYFLIDVVILSCLTSYGCFCVQSKGYRVNIDRIRATEKLSANWIGSVTLVPLAANRLLRSGPSMSTNGWGGGAREGEMRHEYVLREQMAREKR